MKILGITGGIGMGKTTAAGFFRMLDVPVFSSDQAVHWLYANDLHTINKIGKLFPEAVTNNKVNRSKLVSILQKNENDLKELENIVHPRVRWLEKRAIEKYARQRRKFILLDIPLLFETSSEKRIDYIFTITSPAFVQRQRVLKRAGMSEQKLEAILKRQLPDNTRKLKADRVIHGGLGKHVTLREIKNALKNLKTGKRSKWPAIYSRAIYSRENR